MATEKTEKSTQAESVSQNAVVELFNKLAKALEANQATLEKMRESLPNPKQDAIEAAERLTAPDRMDPDGTIKPPLAMDSFLIDGTAPQRWHLTAAELHAINGLWEKKIYGRFADRRIEVIRREDTDGTSLEIRKHSPTKIGSGEYIAFFATYAPSFLTMIANIEKEWAEKRRERREELRRELADDAQTT